MGSSNRRIPVAIVGSGNIGTDLAKKLLRSKYLTPVCLVGIDPRSEGLAMARRWEIEATAGGVDWLMQNALRLGVRIVYEATSAQVHAAHAPRYAEDGLVAVDLTPASLGPGVIPPVNLSAHINAANLNLVSCGGQATIPIVAAVTEVADVPYAEIVSTIASRSAGPGTRANIDEFTEVTARGIVEIGRARKGKAIIILNPAEPPILMRNTVYAALSENSDTTAIEASVQRMVATVASYVPGYRMKALSFDYEPFETPGGVVAGRVSVFLEIRGRGDYLPPYAGNLDIMTASAVRVGETLAEARFAANLVP